MAAATIELNDRIRHLRYAYAKQVPEFAQVVWERWLKSLYREVAREGRRLAMDKQYQNNYRGQI